MSKFHLAHRTLSNSLVLGLLACLFIPARSNAQCQWDWGPGSGLPGVDQPVSATVVFDDGGGPALYAAGSFTKAGGVNANYIAKWNGERWSSLGSGMNKSVYALTVFDDGTGPALYAGGEFTTAGGVSANRIAKWNGSSWSGLGTGMSGGQYPGVHSLTGFNDGLGNALYAAGMFTTAGGVSANRIAKWNGSTWSPVGGGLGSTHQFSQDFVGTLAVLDHPGGGQTLYAGGRFSNNFGSDNIAMWNGNSWFPLGSGTDGYVNALTAFDDGGGPAVYAGGSFTTAGGVSADYIAKWDGSNWSALGSGFEGGVNALRVFDDGAGPALYAGGGHIDKWDGASWSSLGSGINGVVITLTVFDDGDGPAMYAGGGFATAGGVGVSHIAKWDGAAWSALESGTNRGLSALTVFDDGDGPAIYAGGDFTTIGGVSANRIAMWNGSSWIPLGSGTDGYVTTLTAFDDGGGPALYAGGFFTDAGGVSANRVAKWNGTSWSALGSGIEGGVEPNIYVSALTVFDDGEGPALYAAGSFTTAGSVTANNIAKWDGASWSPLGSGLDWFVAALTVFDDGEGSALYVSGGFGTAGGVNANRIAKWDGTNWSALGSGMNGYSVNALAVFDDGGGPALYAGGSYNGIGLAKWNGASWSNVGIAGTVNALIVFDDGGGPALFAGGVYNLAGGVSANHIAKWDGANWAPLGSGLERSPEALAVLDNGWGPALYAGGSFTTAGGHVSAYFAKWSCRLDTPRAISFTPPAASGSASAIRVTLDSLHHVYPSYTGGPSLPFTSFEGEVRWVGAPTQYIESTASGIPFMAAQLQCAPHYQDWSTVGMLHVFGSAIVPSSAYHVEMLADSCQGDENTCTDVSSPLALVTTRWGDVATPYNPPSTTVQPDVSDIAAQVAKFRSVPGALIKARALLAGEIVFGNITSLSTDFGFEHIAACVDAFRGKPYPYAIQACP